MSAAPRKDPTVSTAQVRAGLVRLQAAVREVVASVPAIAGSRPVDLMAALQIDLKLAWKVARISQSGDPFAAVRHLPGAAGWRIATEALRNAGAAGALIERASAAFDDAVRLGTAWAGDRKAFDMMAAGLASGSDMRIDVEHRRQLYLGGSYVWGVRARLALRVDVLGPASRKRMMDCATVRGFVDLERLRADTPWQIEAPCVIDDRGTEPVACAVEPIEKSAPVAKDAAAGPFVMPSFSSSPLPALRPIASDKPPRTLELADNEMGTEGRFTLFHGSILRGVQPVRISKRHHGIFQLWKQRTPAERAVFDLAVHESFLSPNAVPEALLYSDLNARPGTYLHQAKDRIPAGIDAESLGAGMRRAKLADFDRHAELLAAVFERTGWNPSEFRLFRATAAYPPVPATFGIELQLAD